MAKTIKKEKAKLAATMNQFPIFENLTKESKVMLAYCCDPVTYAMGQQVYIEGQNADTLYLIKSGEFELSKEVFLK